MPKFAIVTAIKNEGANLLLLAQSILKQECKPSLWVIIDDNSDSYTREAICKITEMCTFTFSYRLELSSTYDIGRYSYLIRKGVDKVFSINPLIQYISIVDSDVLLAKNYFSEIIKIMESNSKIGIASGLIRDKFISSKNIWGDSNLAGAGLVIRKSCYNNVGGFPLVHAMPDTIFIIKALRKGWLTKTISNTYFLHLKPGGLKRFRKSGEYNAWVGYHPINALFTSFYYTLRPPYLSGISFLVGYSQGTLRKQRIQNDIVFNYFRKEAFQNLVKKLLTKN